MANKIDQFWEIFKAVANDPTTTVTESTNAIAKSDRAKVESYFSNVVDQFTFGTSDYNRLRKFMIDLYASFRTQSSISLASSDPHSLTNSDLDELFRSMGYNLSSSLRAFDENPLEQKVQFFLDLVNLYKVKGTPQSLVDVLQYYGVTEVDIYEFFLKKDAPGSLFFEGKAVAGTTVNASDVGIPYANLTATDPHWLYTAQQILQLDQSNKINLPSKSPYLGVQPTVNLEGAEMSIIVRHVQDQYDSWQSTGVVPTANAEITYTGETVSLLELYLACIYMFNQLYDQGAVSPYGSSDYRARFICYDGTNIDDEIQIIAEYDALANPKVTSRLDITTRYAQHLELFSRQDLENFLVDKTTSGTVLGVINPTLKAALDAAGEPLDVLYSLLKDLALWVRANIGLGFVNFGFILFGLQEFFKDLKPVIEFFKPYRARLLLLETLQVNRRLFNTIFIEDKFSGIDVDFQFHDFITGDSIACCTPLGDSTCETSSAICRREFVEDPPPSYNWRDLWLTSTLYAVDDAVASGGLGYQYICIQAHTSGIETKPGTGTSWVLYWELMSSIECTDTTATISYYSRDTFDCDSYFDIGAVTDIRRHLPYINQNPFEPYQIEYPEDPTDNNVQITMEETLYEHLRCPVSDGTGFVVSEITEATYGESENLIDGSNVISIYFDVPLSTTDYSVGLMLRNETALGSIYNYLVTNKRVDGFDVIFSSDIDSEDYYLDWDAVSGSTNAGSEAIPSDSTEVTVVLPLTCSAANYSVVVSLGNNIDANPSFYAYDIIEKTSSSFTVRFSSPLDSSNYFLDWSVCTEGISGYYNIPDAVSQVTIPITTQIGSVYPLMANIVVEGDPESSSIYSGIITNKTATTCTLQLSSLTDSTNYYVSWVIPPLTIENMISLTCYQSGGFRDFDGVPSSSVPIYDGTTLVGFGPDPGSQGTFDCTHGFDLVFITVEEVVPDADCYLMTEEFGYILLEDDGKIVVDCPVCAIPVADPASGAYLAGTTVALTCATPGATITYTTDGSAPVPGVDPIYTTPIPIT